MDIELMEAFTYGYNVLGEVGHYVKHASIRLWNDMMHVWTVTTPPAVSSAGAIHLTFLIVTAFDCRALLWC